MVPANAHAYIPPTLPSEVSKCSTVSCKYKAHWLWAKEAFCSSTRGVPLGIPQFHFVDLAHTYRGGTVLYNVFSGDYRRD